MPKVYLIAQPTVKRDGKLPDLSPLGEYGEVVVVVNTGEFPSINPGRCLGLINQRMQDFNPDVDYVAWAGGDTLAALFMGVLLERYEVNTLRWLKFNRGWDEDGNRTTDGSGHYRLVEIVLNEEAA